VDTNVLSSDESNNFVSVSSVIDLLVSGVVVVKFNVLSSPSLDVSLSESLNSLVIGVPDLVSDSSVVFEGSLVEADKLSQVGLLLFESSDTMLLVSESKFSHLKLVLPDLSLIHSLPLSSQVSMVSIDMSVVSVELSLVVVVSILSGIKKLLKLSSVSVVVLVRGGSMGDLVEVVSLVPFEFPLSVSILVSSLIDVVLSGPSGLPLLVAHEFSVLVVFVGSSPSLLPGKVVLSVDTLLVSDGSDPLGLPLLVPKSVVSLVGSSEDDERSRMSLVRVSESVLVSVVVSVDSVLKSLSFKSKSSSVGDVLTFHSVDEFSVFSCDLILVISQKL